MMSSKRSTKLLVSIESELSLMLKQLFDFSLALVSLVVLSPVLLIVGLLIKLDSPGPILYKGDRIGQGGTPFKIYKFRTMFVNAEQVGPALTRSKDPRVTRLGGVLRKWKIDEIPQLLNILCGEMSLVGPRPESPGYIKYYTPAQQQVLQVKPGITGLTQVRFRHEETLLASYKHPEIAYIERILPQKLALDLEYIKHQSFILDIKLIIQTFLCLFQADEFIYDGRKNTRS